MKYYYNGKKVRTSDNLYTHAIIKGEKVIACCSRYDLAVKRLNQEINYFNKDIASNEIFLQEAIEGKHDECIKYFKVKNRVELIEFIKNGIERQKEIKFKIVELEVNA